MIIEFRDVERSYASEGGDRERTGPSHVMFVGRRQAQEASVTGASRGNSGEVMGTR